MLFKFLSCWNCEPQGGLRYYGGGDGGGEGGGFLHCPHRQVIQVIPLPPTYMDYTPNPGPIQQS